MLVDYLYFNEWKTQENEENGTKYSLTIFTVQYIRGFKLPVTYDL